MSRHPDSDVKTDDPSTVTLNAGVNKLVTHLVADSRRDAKQCVNLDVEAFITTISKFAPGLWEHICMLTQSVNERKGRKASTTTTSYATRIKRLRRAYLAAVMLFTTNSECAYPFHVLLSDAVEAYGGSSELIILNHIGAIASLDTLKRVMHSVSYSRCRDGLRGLLVAGAFTVASADFLQSHASVYSGCQHRSWHATSIQLVQPRPTTCQLALTTAADSSTIASRRLFGFGASTSAVASSGSERTEVSTRIQPVAQPVDQNPTPALHDTLHSIIDGKSQQRSSPASSPLRMSRSPLSKRVRHARTNREGTSECNQSVGSTYGLGTRGL